MRIVTDEQWAVLTIYGEAAGEPYDGKLAVAKTIRNRMRLEYNSDGTVVGTVLAPKQFSMWNRTPWLWVANADDTKIPTLECVNAWRDSVDTEVLPDDVVLYHAEYVDPYWASKVEFVKQIGRHLFYADPAVRS